MQANIGMGFGVLAFGVAMGALFAVVYCVAYGRVGNLSPRLLSVLLAGGMFLSLYVIPFLKYPAESTGSQPRRDDPAAHAAVSADGGALGGAVRRGGVAGPQSAGAVRRVERDAHRALACRYRAWPIAIVMLVLPTIDETPDDFPADVLYEFRLYSLGTQFVTVGDHRGGVRGCWTVRRASIAA